ncbi:MAG: CaiB/BaiF CoA transferase family protein [Lautropia sp.]
MARIQASTALSRFRVLDLSRVRAGPNCVRILTDFGADVIRIEPPPGVDPNEALFAGNRNGGDFQNLNRNKRSMTLNLKRPGALDVFMRLVEGADVVVENWRPEIKHKLGVDYESLAAVNPRIVLASISGFGQDGPDAGRPGFDQILQGMGGLMSVTGFPESGPVRAGLAVADMSAGLYAAIGILTALHERERSGRGQWVDVSLLHAQIAMMDFQVARYLNDGVVPVQEGNDHPTSSPMGLFRASDGVFNLGASGDGNWTRMCRVLEREAWLGDPEFATEALRVANRKRLNALLAERFASRTVREWVDLLTAAGIPVGPVYTVPQVFEDEQVRHLGVVASLPAQDGKTAHYISQPANLSRTPARVVAPAPAWGEHTDEIMAEIGYSPAQIGRYRADAVI